MVEAAGIEPASWYGFVKNIYVRSWSLSFRFLRVTNPLRSLSKIDCRRLSDFGESFSAYPILSKVSLIGVREPWGAFN